MAKKKKTTKKRTTVKRRRRPIVLLGKKRGRRRSRRLSGDKITATSIITDAVIATATATLASMAAAKLPIANNKLKAGLIAGGGVALALAMGRKNKVAGKAGVALVQAGLTSLGRQYMPNLFMGLPEDDFSYNSELMGLPSDSFLPSPEMYGEAPSYQDYMESIIEN